MRGRHLIDRLREEILVADGAFGTMLRERGIGKGIAFESLNRSQPDLIRELHSAYIAAGAQLIETNTFGANRTKLTGLQAAAEVAELNQLGAAIARQAIGSADVYLAGAVGPLQGHPGWQSVGSLSDDEIGDIYREQIVALANGGVDVLLLETFTDLQQLLLAVSAARTHTDLPLIAQMAFHEHGYTQHGIDVATAYEALKNAGVEVIGANCGRGVRCVMSAVAQMTARGDTLVSAFPNAGLPEFVDGRYLFGAPLPYLTESAVSMADAGVQLIGGCCGTTPEFTRRIAERLRGRRPARRVIVRAETVRVSVSARSSDAFAEAGGADDAQASLEPVPPPVDSIVWKVWPRTPQDPQAPLTFRRPVVIVELDPPRGLNFAPVVERARQLRDMGVDAITMADNPVARLHLGNLTLADIVQREADVPVILHLTCRDSNLLGLQSRLLEAHVRGVHHILALTGDPARVGDMPGATSVYDLNSFGLIELITKFNRGQNFSGQSIGGQTKFTIAVAFNPNGRNLNALIDRLRRKVQKGAHFAMTQPMYDIQRFHDMMDGCKDLRIPIFTGLMPLISEKNAEYLHNEVPGIVLTEEVRRRMKGLSGKEGRKEGLRICKELIDQMLPRADAFYLIPPPRAAELAVELVAHILDRIPTPSER